MQDRCCRCRNVTGTRGHVRSVTRRALCSVLHENLDLVMLSHSWSQGPRLQWSSSDQVRSTGKWWLKRAGRHLWPLRQGIFCLGVPSKFSNAVMLNGIICFLAEVWWKSKWCCPALAHAISCVLGGFMLCFWAFLLLFLVMLFGQKPAPWGILPWVQCAQSCSFVAAVTHTQGKCLLVSCRAHHFL